MANRKKITIQQIAREAGVSVATVSRVVNRTGPVKRDTRDRILELLERYQYIPRRSHQAGAPSILVLVPDFSNPFNSMVLDGIHEAAGRTGHSVLVMQVDDRTELEQLPVGAVCGVVVITAGTAGQLLGELKRSLPVVLCSGAGVESGVATVGIDDCQAARRAVEFLLACGRRRIAFLNSVHCYGYAVRREEGFRQAVAAAGIPVNESWVAHLSSIGSGAAIAHIGHMLGQAERPDAVFAVSDTFAAGAIHAAESVGLEVPGDLAVVGFDNTEICVVTHHPVTTVAQPCCQIGLQACELLLERVRSPATGPKHIQLDTELIVRGSTPSGFKEPESSRA